MASDKFTWFKVDINLILLSNAKKYWCVKINKLTCVDEKPPLGFRWETSQLTIFIPCDKSFFSARYSNAYADVSISTGLALGFGDCHRSFCSYTRLSLFCQNKYWAKTYVNYSVSIYIFISFGNNYHIIFVLKIVKVKNNDIPLEVACAFKSAYTSLAISE